MTNRVATKPPLRKRVPAAIRVLLGRPIEIRVRIDSKRMARTIAAVIRKDGGES